MRDKSKGLHPLKPPDSISDQIYERLKERILHGNIEPGERLRQNQVAQALRASRTPVRDAFRRLEQDGLVERIPRGGVRVTPLDMETIKEVFGIRKVLEGYAGELACERITSVEISSLRALLAQAQELLSAKKISPEKKISQLFQLNSEFHDIIYHASQNSYLMSMIDGLRNIVSRLRFLGLRSYGTWFRAWKEHGQLIDLLTKKDRRGVAKLMKVHLENAVNDVLAGMKMKEKT